jgi:NADPH:quinone reductase-like Zn-dependent oxidoreductase
LSPNHQGWGVELSGGPVRAVGPAEENWQVGRADTSRSGSSAVPTTGARSTFPVASYLSRPLARFRNVRRRWVGLGTGVTSGELRVAETTTFPLTAVDQAYTASTSGHVRGKLVITT